MEPERIKVMRFAENNRISHRQLFRQIILVFPAPFLLCLFKNGAMLGISAMAGTAAAAVVLSFYVIWLIRLTPVYGELSKRTGSFTVRFIGLFFCICDRKFGISFGPSGGGDPGKSDQRDFRKMAVSSCSCSL